MIGMKAAWRKSFRRRGLGLGPGADYLGHRRLSVPPDLPPEPAMTLQIGDSLPSATLMTPTPDGPRPITTDEVFKGKTVALFAVPGAFTPTCSARHLPGYVDHKDALKAKGVDTIACLSVNDPFVMGAWAESQSVSADDVLMLADGNGEFTRAVDLTMDASRGGMGQRSKRYSMLVKDGVIIQLNVEEPGVFEVSSAEHLIAQI
jgi:glutaredoxin/glutathione-dependent peroxiredoxin